MQFLSFLFRLNDQQSSDTPNKVSSSQRSSLSISSHDSTSTNQDGTTEHHRPNHRKNRQAPKPPTQRPQQQPSNDINVNKLADATSNLEIRAPSELLLGFPTGLRTQWRHSAEVLITGAVKYEVNVSAVHGAVHLLNTFL